MKKAFVLICLLLCSSQILASEPEQKFQGFNLQGYTDRGEKSWDVNGETADILGTKVKITNVDANTYGKDEINITAETGIIDQASGNMRLERDVIITNALEGTQLMTDSLDWRRNEDLVTTEDKVIITDKRMTVTGKGMNAQPGLKNAQIGEDVTVRVDTEEEPVEKKFVTITSDGPLVIDQDKSVAVFKDNVVAVRDDQTLMADQMDVHFDMENSKIVKIICTGNVQIEQGENKTFAQKATYDAQTNKIVLSGKPKLIFITEGDNVISSFGNE